MAVAQRSLARNEPVREKRTTRWCSQTGLTGCARHTGSRPFAESGPSVSLSFNEVYGARLPRPTQFAPSFPALPEPGCPSHVQAIHEQSPEGHFYVVTLSISAESHLPVIVNSTAGARDVSTTRPTLDSAKEKPND